MQSSVDRVREKLIDQFVRVQLSSRSVESIHSRLLNYANPRVAGRETFFSSSLLRCNVVRTTNFSRTRQTAGEHLSSPGVYPVTGFDVTMQDARPFVRNLFIYQAIEPGRSSLRTRKN